MSNPIEYRQAKADWQLAVSVAEGAMNYWGDVMSAIQAGKGEQSVAEESTTAEISEAEVVQEQPTTETPIETIAESEPTSEPQPIGSGAFGNIYDTFRGKAKEAFTFLMREKSGDALGVFYRDGVGDIDLVWGDTNGGLAHIISKHVGKDKSFSSVEDAQNEISDIIENGEIVFGADNFDPKKPLVEDGQDMKELLDTFKKMVDAGNNRRSSDCYWCRNMAISRCR